MFVDAGSSNVLEEYSETWPQPLGDLLSGSNEDMLLIAIGVSQASAMCERCIAATYKILDLVRCMFSCFLELAV